MALLSYPKALKSVNQCFQLTDWCHPLIKAIEVINPSVNAYGGQRAASGPQDDRPNHSSVLVIASYCHQSTD